MASTDELDDRHGLNYILPDLSQNRHQSMSQRVKSLMPKVMRGISLKKPKVTDDKLMFTKEDIGATPHPLAKLFRYIMYVLRFTPDEYKAKIFEYGRDTGKTVGQITTSVSNGKKAIYSDNLTIMQLERNLLYAGYDILDLSVTIRNHETGELQVFALSDISKLDVFSPEDIQLSCRIEGEDEDLGDEDNVESDEE